MTETIFVNLFLTIRVFLIGGFLLILPRIMRKGLLFGVYVGEAVAVGSAGQKLVRSWRQGCVLVMLLSLFVGYGISLAGRPVTGNLTGTAVLLCSALLLYIVVYSRARKLVSPGAPLQASKAVASLEKRNPKEAGFAKFSLAICLIAALANMAYAAISYRALPGINFTEAHPLADKSIFIFLFFPYLNLVISLIFALLALLTAGAKHALRDGSDSHSLTECLPRLERQGAQLDCIAQLRVSDHALGAVYSRQTRRGRVARNRRVVARRRFFCRFFCVHRRFPDPDHKGIRPGRIIQGIWLRANAPDGLPGGQRALGIGAVLLRPQ